MHWGPKRLLKQFTIIFMRPSNRWLISFYCLTLTTFHSIFYYWISSAEKRPTHSIKLFRLSIHSSPIFNQPWLDLDSLRRPDQLQSSWSSSHKWLWLVLDLWTTWFNQSIESQHSFKGPNNAFNEINRRILSSCDKYKRKSEAVSFYF